MSPAPTLAGALATAAVTADIVTVIRDDGKIATGAVHESPVDPLAFVIYPVGRLRPFVFYADEVAKLVFE